MLGYGQGTRRYDDDQGTEGGEKGSLSGLGVVGAGAGAGAGGARGAAKQGFVKRHKKLLLAAGALLLLIVVIAVAVPTSLNKSSNKSESASADEQAAAEESKSRASKTGSGSATAGSATTSAPPRPTGRPAWGADGSTVYATQGGTFTYVNKFGELAVHLGGSRCVLGDFARC